MFTQQTIDPQTAASFLRTLSNKRTTKNTKRTETRTSTSITVTLSRTINSQQYQIGGIAVNVSASGAGVMLFLPIAVGCKLELRAKDGSVSARAVVRHCQEMPIGWIVGLEIIEQTGHWSA